MTALSHPIGRRNSRLANMIAGISLLLAAPAPVLAGEAGPAPATPAAQAPAAQAPAARVDAPDAPRIDASWSAGVLARIEQMEYAASPGETGLQAPNRRQNLRTHFRRDGVDIHQRVGAGSGWRFSWRPVAWGRDGTMTPMAPADPVADGARVVYDREGIEEWYENRPDGIEQGFTIAVRPGGSGPLVITATVAPRDGSPDLHIERDADARGADVRTSTGARVLRYEELLVVDAAGNALDARIDVEECLLSIVVDDGRAEYPILVDPLITTASHVFVAEEAGSLFSSGLATAGDVNGDGFSDIIIGAPDYDNSRPDQGRVVVYHGSPDGPSALPDWTAVGGVAGAYLGYSVSTAGDVNGDGYDDIVVGASRHSNGESTEGWVLVWFGGPNGLGDDGFLGNADFVAEGNSPLGEFGQCVAPAGDVNGDGYDEIIVGTRLHTGSFAREGRATVYYGTSTGPNLISAWSVYGGQTDAGLGACVSGAGDVNGDGYADVLIGAPGIEVAGDVEGAAYAWFGGPSGLSPFPTPATADWNASDGIATTDYGRSVAGVGDVNGDGYADVLVGAPYHDGVGTDQGVVFMYLGTAGGPSLLPTWQWSAAQDDALTGWGLSSAGDVNGDGYADVLIGAPDADSPMFINIGGAYLFEGSPSGLTSSPSSETFGTNGLGQYGQRVASAGDVNGDGYGDVLVGEPLDDGYAYLYLGEPAGLSTAHAIQFSANPSGSTVGWSVASAGDVNGDGYSDVIVGAPYFDNGDVDEGVAGVYLGTPDGLTNVGFWLAESNQANALFGWDVGSAGDVNADGYSDVIVGARGYLHHEPMEGAAFVWHGSATGLGANGTPANADWLTYGDVSSAMLGSSVAGAGDVNGDGTGDVIVGAPGRVEVRAFYGQSGVGLPIAPDWVVKDTIGGSELGWDVAGAGDLNRDGYSDVAVGAPQRTDDIVTQDGEGWVFVWYGSASGLDGTGTTSGADWSAQSNQALASFGVSVASAGDVNGDAFADLIVGAHLFDSAQLDVGGAWIWYGSASGLSRNATPQTADWGVTLGQGSAYFGYSVDGAGDVNNDGFGDVVVGAYGYTGTQPGEGSAAVYYGSVVGPGNTPDWLVGSGQSTAGIGRSVAGAGDVNGDGFADILAGAPSWDDGAIQGGLFRVYHGANGGGIDRTVQQYRYAAGVPVHALGISDSETAFRFISLARTPAGRGHVRLEWEVLPLGIPFDGQQLTKSPAFFDTGAPVSGEGSSITLGGIPVGLSPGFVYHWRFRFLTDSPFFPHSPWFSLAGLTRTEMAIRMAGVAVDVAEDPHVVAPPTHRLAVAPNPLSTRSVIRFETERATHVTLTIHDVTGRRVATLVDGVEGAGRHSASWDATTARGDAVAPGTYFVRLSDGARVVTRKIVVAR